jgi:hypothetical protein
MEHRGAVEDYSTNHSSPTLLYQSQYEKSVPRWRHCGAKRPTGADWGCE